jgi:hypothetical protein
MPSDYTHLSDAELHRLTRRCLREIGAAPLICLIMGNGLLIFPLCNSKNLCLSERSPDCRTAPLVWPHKVHSQGEKALQTPMGQSLELAVYE